MKLMRIIENYWLERRLTEQKERLAACETSCISTVLRFPLPARCKVAAISLRALKPVLVSV